MYRLGKKFGIGSLPAYMIPFYNLYLLNNCARLPAHYFFLMFIPFAGPFIWGTMAFGNIAQRLSKDYWIFGLGSVVVGVPFFIMAFDKSMPIDTNDNRNLILQHKPSVNPPLQVMNQQNHIFTGSTAFLVGISGMYQGSVIPIPTEGITIGRDPNIANIIISDANISKQHVRVTLHPQRFDTVIIQDLGSTHGTFYGGGNGQWEPVQNTLQITSGMYTQIRLGLLHEIFEIKYGT